MKKDFFTIIENNDCLFRYRPHNQKSIDDLKYNRLHFSSPSEFNDPYDTLIYINSEKIVREIIGNINRGMDSYLESKKPFENVMCRYADFVWNNEKSKEQMLKDRFEHIFSAIDTIRLNIRKFSKMICFSEEYNSVLMWSHYAEYHKGFCMVYRKSDIENSLRYDKNGKEIKNKTKLLKVNYVDAQFDMTNEVTEYIRNNMFENMGDIPNIDSTIPAEIIRKAIAQKSTLWSYEKEWRLIPRIPKIEEESPLNYLECKPLAVIVGSKCFSAEREELINICNNNGIPVYGIYLKENDPHYKLVVNNDGDPELASNKYIYFIKASNY